MLKESIHYTKRIVEMVKRDDLWGVIRNIQEKTYGTYQKKRQYKKWIAKNETEVAQEETFSYNPLITIVVPVYNVSEIQLRECIESVAGQIYPNWELNLVDDASTWTHVRQILKEYEAHPQINVIYRKVNGHISQATNDGIFSARGEFIGLLDCDDVLSVHSLQEVVRLLNQNADYDLIYSDEDKITENGKDRMEPFFKPDWSPDTLMSYMYLCHFCVYRAELLKKLGGMRIGLEGAQDYDLALRFTEVTNRIGHIDKILYHWRKRRGSTSVNVGTKPYLIENAKKAKLDAIKRRGLKGELEWMDRIFQYRVVYKNEEQPLVSIIIPTRNNVDGFQRCMNSIVGKSKHQNYEIIVVDYGSNEREKMRYTEVLRRYGGMYEYEAMDCNLSRIRNKGASLAKGSILLFLDDNVEVNTEKWLDIMVGHASLTLTGAVGVKLLYPNSNRILHNGIIHNLSGPVYVLDKKNNKDIHYFAINMLDVNYSAVTGACLMVEKKKYNQVMGFSEEFSNIYYDVDFCYKLIEAGYYNVLRNDVILYHNVVPSGENKERVRIGRDMLDKRHPQYRKKDIFYNRNLTQVGDDYSLNR